MKTALAPQPTPGYRLIRIRATGQVTEMVPAVATAMILGGTAEEVGARPESAMAGAAPERAVTPAHAGPQKKPLARAGRNS